MNTSHRSTRRRAAHPKPRRSKRGMMENIVNWIIIISLIIVGMVLAGLAYSAIKAQQSSCKGLLCF